MIRAYVAKASLISAFMIITIAAIVVPSSAFAWHFSAPAQAVKPTDGVFSFPAASFEDGKARYFEYQPAPNKRIRFFVVKSTDGVTRAAFDACEKCFRALKGYVQNGDNMVCINCGLKFRTDKVNVVTGGCNPSALKRTEKDGQVVIAVQDVLEGQRYFQ